MSEDDDDQDNDIPITQIIYNNNSINIQQQSLTVHNCVNESLKRLLMNSAKFQLFLDDYQCINTIISNKPTYLIREPMSNVVWSDKHPNSLQSWTQQMFGNEIYKLPRNKYKPSITNSQSSSISNINISNGSTNQNNSSNTNTTSMNNGTNSESAMYTNSNISNVSTNKTSNDTNTNTSNSNDDGALGHDGLWACKRCTFRNDPVKLACVICYATRPCKVNLNILIYYNIVYIHIISGVIHIILYYSKKMKKLR